ncbi:MAG: hypothetical protein ACD_79C00243G0002, partial [uncultured bacterium]
MVLILIVSNYDKNNIIDNDINAISGVSNSEKAVPKISASISASDNLTSIKDKTIADSKLNNNKEEEICVPEKINEVQNLVEVLSLKENSNAILLNTGGFDTSKGEVLLPDELKYNEDSLTEKEIYYIVQFNGPVLPSWKDEVRNYGAYLKEYVPNNAFLIKMSKETKEKISALSYVNWVGLYHPAFKISKALLQGDVEILNRAKLQKRSKINEDIINSKDTNTVQNPEIKELVQDSQLKGPEVILPQEESNNSVLLMVQTYEGGNLSSLFSLAENIADINVIDSSDGRKSRIIIDVPNNILESVNIKFAQSEKVEWIEPYIQPNLNNNELHWVVQGNVKNQNPLWDHGLTGAGQIVGVGDTGLDVDMVFFWDGAQGIPNATVNLNQRKVIAYYDLAGNGDYDRHDHGTHVSGTILGKSHSTNSDYNGIAYDAKLVMQDIGNGGTLSGIPSDLTSYFLQAYNAGARIHSNSWGSAVNGAYTSYSQDADEFMWNHKDFLICFSAGNSGDATNTVGSPGTAKNIICSGASENAQTGYNQEDVAYFSSNGPTDDGRMAPTVTAPGHYVMSPDNDGNIYSFNSSVRSMSGTSMSCPTHAGSAALVRQYYMDGFYPDGVKNSGNSIAPSAALIKATMVNSAVNMTGEYTDATMPSTGQGWGRILLDNALYFQGDAKKLWIEDNQSGLQTNGEKTYILNSNGEEALKVTLVWTDYFPSISAGVQIVNDLDLTVTGPNNAFKGNVFTNGVSTTGGNYDRLNVVENIYISTPVAGAYTISVKAYNVPNGPQPFAIVATGLNSQTSKGSVFFNKEIYGIGASATVSVSDMDLDTSNGLDTATIHLESTSDAGSEMILTETSVHSKIFSNTFVIENILQIVQGDQITATYVDANDGTGQSPTISASSTVDLLQPGFTEVNHLINNTSAVINWKTDEMTTGTLYYRKKNTLPFIELNSTLLQTSHSLSISNLESATVYEYKIKAIDEAGNEFTNDNSGNNYTFSTWTEQLVYLENAENGQNSFVISGTDGAGGNALWHISSYLYNSSSHSWYYGLESSKTYNTGFANSGYLTGPQVDLSAYDNAILKFKHILKTENYTPYDLAKVQISTNGTIWNTLLQSTKSQSDWEEISLDISSYSGQKVYFRFSFNTVDNLINGYLGWLIDDIKIITFIKADDDHDGLSNDNETQIGTDPNNPDTDGDALSDGDEVLKHGTDPLNSDTDGDTISDGQELNTYNTNPLKPDTDDDGLTDSYEIVTSLTDPLDDDSDDDGIKDGAELNTHLTDPLDSDSDNDGLSDGEEIITEGTNPLVADTDTDGLSDGLEVKTYSTNPLDTDSDDDGLTDYAEIITYKSDPNDTDTDNEGLLDADEVNIYGTDPTKADTDNDAINDKIEIDYWAAIEGAEWNSDTDSDGIINLLDADSDNDGVVDGAEFFYGTDPTDANNYPVFPDINIKHENINITNMQKLDLGELAFSSNQIITFTIENQGNADLVLTDNPVVTIIGPSQDAFSILQQPSATIMPGESSSFILSFNPLKIGFNSVFVYISSNDFDEGFYEINITSDIANALGDAPAPKYRLDLKNTGRSEYRGAPGNNIKWRHVLGNFMNYGAPAVGKDGTIYYIDNYNKELHALADNGNTVTKKWACSIGTFSMTSPLIGIDGTIYVASYDKIIALYDRGTTYDKKWEANIPYIWEGSPVIGPDGTIYVTNDFGVFYALRDTGTSLETKWTKDFSLNWAYTPAIADDGTIYLVDFEGEVTAWQDNGTEAVQKWSYALNEVSWTSPLLRSDGTIYVGCEDGKLYALKDNGNSAIKKWEFDTGALIGSSSAAMSKDGIIYVGSWNGKIYALEDRETSVVKKWEFFTNGIIEASPVIDKDGTIYIGTCGQNNTENIEIYNMFNKYKKQVKEEYINNNNISALPYNVICAYDTKFFAITDNGNSSQKKWELSLNGFDECLFRSGVIGKNGTIYLSPFENGLIAININPLGDDDNDGLINSLEQTIETNPLDADTDDDAINDGIEKTYWDGREDTNYDSDTDNDGLINLLDNDSDGDTLSDGDEVNKYGTDPAINDNDGIKPAIPQNISIEDIGDNNITIKWNAHADKLLTGYNIYRNGTKINQSLSTEISYSDKNLTQGNDFSYEVTAVDYYDLESDKTPVVSATSGKPLTPQGLGAVSGNGQVTLSWTANTEGDLAGYNVYLKSGAVSATNIALGKTYTKNNAAGNGALLNGVTAGFTDYDFFNQGGNFVINLGQIYNISKIGLKFFDVNISQRYYRYTVEVSSNGINYTQVINKSAGQWIGLQEDTFAVQSARYIRINGLFSSNGVFHLQEVLAYEASTNTK